MPSVNAFSLAPNANDWLANSRHPRVLHVFNRACNLINERRDVLSIVTSQIGDGPFNLVVENDVLFSEHLGLQSPVSVSPNQLNLGNITIFTRDARLWNPRPDWYVLHDVKKIILDRLAELQITGNPRSGGFETPLDKHSRLLDHQRLPITQSLISSLCSSLATADIATAKSLASQLAGLGIGLTPSGDDFLMGTIYAIWIIHHQDVASILATEIANTAAPLTTSLSAAWLRSAGRGEAGILWHQFFNALLSADRAVLRDAIDKVLAVGETSGADALAGFFDILIRWAEIIHAKIS